MARAPKCWCGHYREQHLADGDCQGWLTAVGSGKWWPVQEFDPDRSMAQCDCALYLTAGGMVAKLEVRKAKSPTDLKKISRAEFLKRRQLAFIFLKARKVRRIVE